MWWPMKDSRLMSRLSMGRKSKLTGVWGDTFRFSKPHSQGPGKTEWKLLILTKALGEHDFNC